MVTLMATKSSFYPFNFGCFKDIWKSIFAHSQRWMSLTSRRKKKRGLLRAGESLSDLQWIFHQKEWLLSALQLCFGGRCYGNQECIGRRTLGEGKLYGVRRCCMSAYPKILLSIHQDIDVNSQLWERSLDQMTWLWQRTRLLSPGN